MFVISSNMQLLFAASDNVFFDVDLFQKPSQEVQELASKLIVACVR